MSHELSIGKRYRFTLRGKTGSGCLEGVVRSVSLPAGVLGNRDGAHCVWVAGEQFEWFLEPAEISEFEEVEAHPPEKARIGAPSRSMRGSQPYRGSCLRSRRRPPRPHGMETHPLPQHLATRHRRGQ